ncbi:type I 3-dehydroquinate dehydratase [Halodesulfurarchaeum sp.]|uniref:type I 3-dehydroquinate dehydratase n=1 Tax=Halodesulfurarchaeum sp. TaxID=1980530 RepID=UPI002FC3925B
MLDFESFRLAASTATLDAEPRARELADLLEFRMDLTADPLEQLHTYEGELDILVTNRPQWEGGEREETPERREELLEALSIPAVSAVDLELRTLESPDKLTDMVPVLDAAREEDLPIIVSVHDFERAPSRETLVDFAHRGSQYGTVAKLAVTPETPDGVLDLLQATHDLTREGLTVASMAMGELGSHTRVVAPVYGSKLGYAPIETEDATAPGQFDLATLSSLLETFGARHERI